MYHSYAIFLSSMCVGFIPSLAPLMAFFFRMKGFDGIGP